MGGVNEKSLNIKVMSHYILKLDNHSQIHIQHTHALVNAVSTPCQYFLKSLKN